MISLDLAKRLKEAGLEWEPKIGDFAWYKEHQGVIICIDSRILIIQWSDLGRCYSDFWAGDALPPENMLFLPRLDQLLAEIERRGYGYDLHTLTTNHEHKYYCAIKLLECACGYRIDNISWGPFKADNPEDAAAKALIWVLEREKGEQG